MKRWWGFSVAIAGAALLLPPPVPAIAYTYTDGGAIPFAGTTKNDIREAKIGGRYSLRLQRTTTPIPLSGASDPVSAWPLADGGALVADSGTGKVVEYDSSGGAGRNWAGFVTPTSAQRIGNGHTLICDRGGNTVAQFDGSEMVWSYGDGSSGLGPGKLSDPRYAIRLTNGNALICDGSTGNRVLEVDPDNNKVWQYGEDGMKGTGPGKLSSPRHVQELTGGNFLITDESGHRVLQVNRAGEIVWQFGESGVSGSDTSHLESPSFAWRFADGSTMVADSGNGRILRVSQDRQVTDIYGTGGEGEGLDGVGTAFPSDGATLIANAGKAELLKVSYKSTGRYETEKLNMGVTPKKWVESITPVGFLPAGTSLKIQYALDDGAWKDAGLGGVLSPRPSSSVATVRFRVDMTTSDPNNAPLLSSLKTSYSLGEFPPWDDGLDDGYVPDEGEGDSSSDDDDSGTAGTGSDETGGGTGLGSGTGSGSGLGSGSGSGLGSGSGSGMGSGTSSGSGAGVLKSTGGGMLDKMTGGLPSNAASKLLSGFVMKKGSGRKGASVGTGGGGGALDPLDLLANALLLGSAFVIGLGSSLIRRARLRVFGLARSIMPGYAGA